MELKDIAVISGKGGLFKTLKPTRTGVIVESIDEKKSRFAVNANSRISVLEEISLYTTTEEGSTPLKKIFKKIYDEFKEDPGVTQSSSPEELKAFMKHIEPEYDEEKVYVSDIKKLVNWYQILMNHYPEVITAPEKKEEEIHEEKSHVKEHAATKEPKNIKKPEKPLAGHEKTKVPPARKGSRPKSM